MKPTQTIKRTGSRAAAAVLIALTALSGCGSTPTTGPSAKQYSFWPPYPDQPRIQFLRSYQFSKDIEPEGGKLDALIYGEAGQQVLPINKPYGVTAVDGRIYVCDIRNPGVVVLDLRNQQTRVIGSGGVTRLVRPTDVAIAPDGLIYVADLGANRIVVYDQNERYLTRFEPPQFKPGALAVTTDRIYVTDYVSKQVLILDRSNGQELGRIGEEGGGGEDGAFIRPLGIDVDVDGRVIVGDVLKGRVQVFSPTGELLFGFGKITTAIGEFVRPKHLATDRDGRIYVVDAAFQNVQVFNHEGKLLTWFGNAGDHPGAMFLPVGVSVLDGNIDLFEKDIHPSFQAERLLIVTNQFGPAKVAVYALGQLKPGASVEDTRADQAEINLGVTDTGGPEQVPVDTAPASETPAELPEMDPQRPPVQPPVDNNAAGSVK
jgi:DNA-binding beta-propeller fold protein YncE